MRFQKKGSTLLGIRLKAIWCYTQAKNSSAFYTYLQTLQETIFKIDCSCRENFKTMQHSNCDMVTRTFSCPDIQYDSGTLSRYSGYKLARKKKICFNVGNKKVAREIIVLKEPKYKASEQEK